MMHTYKREIDRVLILIPEGDWIQAMGQGQAHGEDQTCEFSWFYD